MTRAAILGAACALAMAVSSGSAAEHPVEEKAADAAVVKACLDVAAARREAPDKAAPADSAKPETGPEAYLDAAARVAGSAPESCIGVLAGPCMETEEGQSTYGMMACIGREIGVWDARLDAAYREKLAPPPEPGSDAASNKIETEQLRTIQLAWLAWRDAACEVLYADGIPIHGSLGKVDGVDCHMVLTARQALWMEGKLTLGAEN